MTTERLAEIRELLNTRPANTPLALIRSMTQELLDYVDELRAEKGRLECPLCQRYMHCPYEEPPPCYNGKAPHEDD